MKIELNAEINRFFLKSSSNLRESIRARTDEDIVHVRDKKELLLKSQGCKTLRELLINKKLILENPYYKNIKFKNISSQKFKLEVTEIPKDYAMNISWLVPDENREMNDRIKMGYFKENIKIPTLKQEKDGKCMVWMSPTLSEQNTMNPYIDRNAKGNILTFGLGIGYFVYMASLKDDVESITVIEYSQEVIDMFKEIILPQFNTNKEINIIKGDAFDYFNKEFLDKFDYIFVDIWEGNEDGFDIIEKLLEKENYQGNIDYWVEFSCYSTLRTLIFLYLRSLAQGNLQELLFSFTGKDRELLAKIHKYFRQKNHVVTDVNEIKTYLYDIKIIREILSTKI